MSKFQSLKNILPKVLLENKLNDSVIVDFIKSEWQLKLDPIFTKITSPERLNPYTKTLFIKASSSLWAKELSEKENVFLKKINDAFPEIKIEHLKITK